MQDLGHKTDTDVDFIAPRLKSRRLLQVIVATMIGLAISGAINLIEGDWTNLNVHVPAQLALLDALWALRKARFALANTVLLVTATVSISVLVWQNSGLRDPAMIAYPAILAFASTMGGRRLFLSLLAMILLVVALVGVANLQGWHVNAVPTHTLGSMINVSIVLSLTAFLIWLMAGDLRAALANVTAENERVRQSQVRIEFLGLNAIHGAMSPSNQPEPYEIAVRVAARCNTREEAFKVGREVDGMAVSGVAMTGKRVPHQDRTREIIGVWSSLVAREKIKPAVSFYES